MRRRCSQSILVAQIRSLSVRLRRGRGTPYSNSLQLLGFRHLRSVARTIQIHFPDEIYSVCSRMLGKWCSESDLLVRRGGDRNRLVVRLEKANSVFEQRRYLYCLIFNHFPLLMPPRREAYLVSCEGQKGQDVIRALKIDSKATVSPSAAVNYTNHALPLVLSKFATSTQRRSIRRPSRLRSLKSNSGFSSPRSRKTGSLTRLSLN